MDSLETLVQISRAIGADPALVQGGGGNTSVKTPDGMWIKASGVLLAEVSSTKGFVKIDDKLLRQQLSTVQTEADYNALVQRCIRGYGPAQTPPRPSMEAGFHALLGAAVLHSHSVWANLLCCAEDGPDQIAALFPDALWVPYTTPGLPLMQQIAARLAKVGQPSAVFLQNHGVIVSAPSVEAAWVRHQQIDSRIRDHFLLPAEAFATFAQACLADESHILFPDQAVYLTQPDLSLTPAGQDVLKAYSFLRQTLATMGRAARYLTSDDVATLLALDAEKYRQSAARAS